MQHYIYHGRINEQGVRNAMILIGSALKSGAAEITLHLGSHGGDVNAGMTLYNYLRMLPIETRTHALGVCESIAATVLLGGKKRSAAPASVISIHAATYAEGPFAGKRSPNTDLTALPFKTVCGWSDDDIAKRFAENGDFRMTPDEASALGVIDEVCELSLTASDDVTIIKVE